MKVATKYRMTDPAPCPCLCVAGDGARWVVLCKVLCVSECELIRRSLVLTVLCEFQAEHYAVK